MSSHIAWRLFVVVSSSHPYSNYPHTVKVPEHISDQYKRGTSAKFHFITAVCHNILSVVVYLPDSILKTAVVDDEGEKDSVRGQNAVRDFTGQ